MNESFEAFFQRRLKAAEDYANGDGEGVDAIVPHAGEATFHSPSGATVNDAGAVAARYRQDVQSFAAGGKSSFEVLQTVVDDGLAFWTGFQLASVHPKGKDGPVEMRIRVTEVFRRINGAWKMVHRHADFGQSPPPR